MISAASSIALLSMSTLILKDGEVNKKYSVNSNSYYSLSNLATVGQAVDRQKNADIFLTQFAR